MYTRDYYTDLAIQTNACCALFAAGGDCCHSIGPEDIYPSDEEMIAEGWYKNSEGVWTSDEWEAQEAAKVSEQEKIREASVGIPF